MKEFSNNLTPAQLERLVLLAEECGEVVQIIGKIIRHGYESHNPCDDNKTINRELLNKEISHIYVALRLMDEEGDTDDDRISWHKKAKRASIQKYLHHNTI